MHQPGPIVLFGSGETSTSGCKTFRKLFSSLDPPLRVAILETPAGFELNSAWVAAQVANFLEKRLQNFAPQVSVVPARKRNTAFSPDDAGVIAPLLTSNVIYMGAGSPTYAVRQLEDSLAWHALTLRHRLGAGVALASAAVLAAGACTIPVYEIYKVGEDVHWKRGLDFLGPYNLSLAFVPHWNNADGGVNLDTSRCYIGRPRFAALLESLPEAVTMVGIEEHTSLLMDLNAQTCQALGRGAVVLVRGGEEERFDNGQTFAIAELGPFRLPDLSTGIPPQVLDEFLATETQAETVAVTQPPSQVWALVEEREAARARRDWGAADRIRAQINRLGWHVRDTPDGPQAVSVDR